MGSPGHHAYKPFPGVDRCSICLLVDGDCLTSPNADVNRDGHYLHGVEPLIRVAMGEPVRDEGPVETAGPHYIARYASVEVFFPEADYYKVQGERDELRRTMALINAEVHHTKGVDLKKVKRLLQAAGHGPEEAKLIIAMGEHALAARKEDR